MGINNSGIYVSVRRNAENAPKIFGYNSTTGFFGEEGNHKGIREVGANDPIAAAKELFAIMKAGGDKHYSKNLSEICVLPDNTYISMRLTTKSGSPAVEINIKKNPFTTKVKNQKIHFIKKEK